MPNEKTQALASSITTKQPAELLIWSGVLLLVLGVLHLPFYWFAQGSWEGPVSVRKPILFGVSTGLTLCSVGWLFAKLPSGRFDAIVSVIVSASLVIEVLLITVQFWRGEASHFNRSTYFDSFIDIAMLGLITMAFCGLCYLGVRSLGRVDLPRDYRLAIRLGMGFLIVSCIIGFVISSHGYSQLQRDLTPETVGQSGVAKFPHGVAIHALQILPALVYILRTFNFSLRQRMFFLQAVSITTILMVAFAIHQTWLGYGRFELSNWIGVALLSSAATSIAVPVCILVAQRIALGTLESSSSSGLS